MTPRHRLQDRARSAPRGLLHVCGVFLHVCGVFLAVLTVTVSLLTASHRHDGGSANPTSCVICQAAEQASATPAPQPDLTEPPPAAPDETVWPTTVAPVRRLATPAEARAPPA